ncbi:MAG: FHA domain-containing protein [Myxococcales bacterium]|nr:FHA domain-containing protein [Myxococcales bacterium]
MIVESGRPGEARLTFDGMQRVVIGRGASCDVRLPDPTVSHRHASIRAQGAEFLLFDEGSTNGTFVGDAAIAPRTSRIVRSGDKVRFGRVWIELRVEQRPVTRDVAAATRDLALALVSEALAARGLDGAARVRVVEGPDLGATLALREDGRAYLVGRGAHCDLALADTDVSREHVRITRREDVVELEDLGAKNGTWVGGTRAEKGAVMAWKPSRMVRLGRTVLAFEDPTAEALARIEGSPDEALAPAAAPPPPGAPAPPPPVPQAAEPSGASSDRVEGAQATPAPLASLVALGEAEAPRPARPRRRLGWSLVDLLVMGAALCVLLLSIAGLVWLLR